MNTKFGLDYECLKSLVENSGGTIRLMKKALQTREVKAIHLDGKIGGSPNTALTGPDHFEGLNDLSTEVKAGIADLKGAINTASKEAEVI
ncbi:MAG: hypothetical protein OXH73_03985 [Caldilineaceae bacterium]|nr:hypothetical protein [Caldilineaceae bacterium]